MARGDGAVEGGVAPIVDLAATVGAHPAFRGVPLPELGGLRVRSWRRHEILFRQGDPSPGLLLIFEGRVRISRCSPEGRHHVLHEEMAGGSLGEVPLFAGGGMAGTAVAVETTSGLVLPIGLVRATIASNPAFALHLLTRLAKRTRGLAERLEQVTTRRVQTRLAAFLLERARRATGSILSLGMTQRELAEELGSVREVVVRELRSLCRQGALVAHGGGRYQVTDKKLLRNLAAGPVEQKSQR